MRRLLSALTLLSALPLPARADQHVVGIGGRDYLYVQYASLISHEPEGWLALSWPEVPWNGQQVMLPVSYTFCDFFYMQKTEGRPPKDHILFGGPVAHFLKDSLRGMLTPDTDWGMLETAAAHCEEVVGGPSAGMSRDPLFFAFGVLRQDPWSSKPGRFTEPELDLHGAFFAETFGEGAWVPTYGRKQAQVPPPKGLPDRYRPIRPRPRP